MFSFSYGTAQLRDALNTATVKKGKEDGQKSFGRAVSGHEPCSILSNTKKGGLQHVFTSTRIAKRVSTVPACG